MAVTRDDVSKLITNMAERFDPAKAPGVNATIQFDLSGDNGGMFWVRIAEGKATAGEGAADGASVTVRASADDYVAVANGAMGAMQAFMAGKFKVQGDMGLAMKLASLFSA
jgi:putative sterol carrier protein